jgi:hypothetical protein
MQTSDNANNGQEKVTNKAKARKLAHSVDSAAFQLDLCPATIWKYAAAGKIRLVKIGGRTVMADTELQRILKNGF